MGDWNLSVYDQLERDIVDEIASGFEYHAKNSVVYASSVKRSQW